MTLYSITKSASALPLVLFVTTILSRLPFASKMLYHMDSVQYALALDHYDIGLHQPHPPGYFVYILMGRLMHWIIADPNQAFIALSIIFTAGTVVIVYLLAKEIFDDRTALLAAIFAITSPNLWFHGAIALNYGLESFFSVSIAYLCWKITDEKSHAAWVLLAIILASSGGIRQNTPVFLLPLVIYACRQLPLRWLLLGSVTFSLVTLGWFVPMISATGGWSAYSAAFWELWHFNTGQKSVFEHGFGTLLVYAKTLLNFITFGIGAGVVVLPLCGYIVLRQHLVERIDKKKLFFFMFWVGPAFLFYLLIFIHPANPGYALVFTPPLYILLAKAVIFLAQELSTLLRWRWNLVIPLILITANLYLFLFSSYPISAYCIRKHDQDLALIINHLKKFDPAATALFVGPYIFFGYRQIMYYLPEYLTYQAEYSVTTDGQVREFFGGINRQTFRARTVDLPRNITRFASLVLKDSREQKFNSLGIQVDNLLPESYVASGSILLVKRLYPEIPLIVGRGRP
jgi:hypothetical protein